MPLAKPLDVTLEVAPRARFDVVDLRSRFAAEHDALGAYPRCLYWSFHTTAGFLDRSLAARLSAQHIPTYVDAFRTLFPEGAGYRHDQIDLRTELAPEQKATEPLNADSHLAFIGGGLHACVSYDARRSKAIRNASPSNPSASLGPTRRTK